MRLGFGGVLILAVLATSSAKAEVDKDRVAELTTDIAGRCTLILDRQDPNPVTGLGLVKQRAETLLQVLGGDMTSTGQTLMALEPRCQALLSLFEPQFADNWGQHFWFDKDNQHFWFDKDNQHFWFDKDKDASPSILYGNLNFDSTKYLGTTTAGLKPRRDPPSQTGYHTATDGTHEATSIEPFFPWPPPEPFLFDVRERKDFPPEVKTLDQVSRSLGLALATAGYTAPTFFTIQQDGFALVTRMERIDAEKRPIAGPTRWDASGSLAIDMDHFSLRDCLLGILTRRVGFFRVFVLLVTPETVHPDPNKKLQPETIQEWQHRGSLMLPESIGKLPFSDRDHVYILVYEFEKDEGEIPKMVELGRVEDHVKAAGIKFGWSQ